MPIQSNVNKPEMQEDLDLESQRTLLESTEDDKTELTKRIGWNVETEAQDNETILQSNRRYLAEVQVSHKQITERFIDLLHLFDNYTKIMVGEASSNEPTLRRARSQELAQRPANVSDRTKASVSLSNVQLSDSTLVAYQTGTCEVSIQTSESLINKDKFCTLFTRTGDPQKHFDVKQTEHTLHIEVESVASSTALVRLPLLQRLWQVLVDVGYFAINCLYMIGDNFTYVLFIVFCLWCFYLVIARYSSFLHTNVPGNGLEQMRLGPK